MFIYQVDQVGESHFPEKENQASCILSLFEICKTSVTQ